MKLHKVAAAAVLVSGMTSTAYAQDANAGATAEGPVIQDSFDDNSDRVFNDSFDDNSEVYNDSFDDNSERVFNDSFDDLSDHYNGTVQTRKNSTFDDNAVVAEATLSNVVTGVDVSYGDIEDSAKYENRLVNSGNAFQNYSGINALNQNTGVAASQNANISIAVSGDGFNPE
ncbi:hypothetical protein [Erythrobacter sp. F6033]|uniref:hypothetical protein n=1 Tax=Erythrobacter sp. F6033 TaxID=2926401 RepID=UPI001FF101D6|nr:hypothetical protein [Erythrobacter sp. F6033]MCK0127363.1 hypothetical protein [Erythrobacter sp. F6033]